MKLIITTDELEEKGLWPNFAMMRGYNIYALNEGLDPNKSFILTEKEAIKLGLIKNN